jgi:hypothetical protein
MKGVACKVRRRDSFTQSMPSNGTISGKAEVFLRAFLRGNLA